MCGIAGIWWRDGRAADPESLRRMIAMIRHRGPDGEGVYTDGGLGLGHARLTILDATAAADQPMATADRRHWLVYNGEVHNYLELRRELEGQGVRFRSSGDTEVVLASLVRWGPDALSRFNGMWALAFWDAREEELLLSRDRMGIKPLVVSERGRRLAFASEAKAILAAFPEEAVPDEDELIHFLAGGQPQGAARTFLAGVRHVRAGTWLRFRNGRPATERRYWEPAPGEPGPPLRPGQAGEELKALLAESVRLRLRSDVPVGFALSGGVDSSMVTMLARPWAGVRPYLFSLHSPTFPQWDESGYAKAVADALGEVRLVRVEPEAASVPDAIEALVWHHDGPTPIRGRLPAWFLLREVGRHVRVLLEGHGPDELLGGYGRMIAPHLTDAFRDGPRAGLRAVARLPDFAPLIGGLRRVPRLWAAPVRGRWRLHWTSACDLLHPRLGHRIQSALDPARFFIAWMRGDRPRHVPGHLDTMLWQVTFLHGLPEILHMADAIAMAHSVENRPPVLDHRIVEWCLRLPGREKIRDGWTKAPLRDAGQGILPDQVRLRRAKLGFPAAYSDLLRAHEPRVRDWLTGPRAAGRGLWDTRRVTAWADAFFRGRGARGPYASAPGLWRLITTEVWFRAFIDPSPPAPKADGRPSEEGRPRG